MGDGWIKFPPKSLHLLLCNKRYCPSLLSLSRHPTRSWIHPEALHSKIKKKRNKGEGCGVKKKEENKEEEKPNAPETAKSPKPSAFGPWENGRKREKKLGREGNPMGLGLCLCTPILPHPEPQNPPPTSPL